MAHDDLIMNPEYLTLPNQWWMHGCTGIGDAIESGPFVDRCYYPLRRNGKMYLKFASNFKLAARDQEEYQTDRVLFRRWLEDRFLNACFCIFRRLCCSWEVRRSKMVCFLIFANVPAKTQKIHWNITRRFHLWLIFVRPPSSILGYRTSYRMPTLERNHGRGG